MGSVTQLNQRVFTRTTAENTQEFSPTDWGLFVGVSVIWGASFLLIAFALEGLTPAMVTFGRVSLGAMTLWGLRLARPGSAQRVRPEDRLRVLLLSVLWVGLPFSLFPLAQERINSALTGLLNGATPIFVAIVAVVLFRQRPRGPQLLGLGVGFLGAALISAPALTEGSSEAFGVVLVLVATVCYGFAINLSAPLQQRYGAVSLMSSVLGLATVWVTPPALLSLGDNQWNAGPVVAVVALGAVGTGVAYWTMATLVGRVGAVRASFITYLIPVVSLLLGVTIRGDQVAAVSVVGAGLIIGGALLASRRAEPGRG